MGAEQTIRELGIELPEPVQPIGSYVRWVQTGNLLFISGTGPGNETQRGKLGSTMSVEEGYAARPRGRAADPGHRQERRLATSTGSRASSRSSAWSTRTPDFEDQPQVINGCSDLFIEVFGEAGRHTRSAVGLVALPGQIPVEIECTMEVSATVDMTGPIERTTRLHNARALVFNFGVLRDDETGSGNPRGSRATESRA